MGKICSRNSTKSKQIHEQTHGRLSVSCVSLSCIKGKSCRRKNAITSVQAHLKHFPECHPMSVAGWGVFPDQPWELLMSRRFMNMTLWTALDSDITASEDVGLCHQWSQFLCSGLAFGNICSMGFLFRYSFPSPGSVRLRAESRILLTLPSLKRANSK